MTPLSFPASVPVPLQSGPGLMQNTTLLLIAGAVIVLVIGVGFYLLRRRYMNQDDANQNSGTERIARGHEREQYDIPLRTRVGGMPWEAKAVLGTVFVFTVVVVYNVWQYLKTGSPAQMVYAAETQAVALSVAMLFVGIWYERSRARKYEGEIHVKYEADASDGDTETTTEVIHYNPQDVVEDEDGIVVHEVNRRRVFGLFPTPRRIADDRRFRDSDVWRPPEDKIGHRIPPHAEEVAPNVWEFYTQGSQLNRSPNTVADVEYRPPWSLSNEDYMRMHADMDMMQRSVREVRAQNAHLQQHVRKLEQTVEEHFENDWTKFIGVIQDLAPLVGSNRTENTVQRFRDNVPGHSSREDSPSEDAVIQQALNGNRNGGDD